MGKKRLLISTITIFTIFLITGIMAERLSAGKQSEKEWDGNAKAAEEALFGHQAEEGLEEASLNNAAQDSIGQKAMENLEEDLSDQKVVVNMLQDSAEQKAVEGTIQNSSGQEATFLSLPAQKEEDELKILGLGLSDEEGIEDWIRQKKISDVLPQAPSKETESEKDLEAVFQYDYAVAKVTEYVNIREGAGTEYAVLGKLYRNSYAKIIERGEEWTKVSSGSVTGYIRNDYLSFDEEAVRALHKENALLAEVNAGTVNLRTGPGTDSEIIKEVKKGDTFLLDPAKCVPEWTAVLYEGAVAYLSSQFVSEKITFQTAISKEEEEKAAVEAAAKAALEKSMLEAKKYTPAKTNRTAVDLNDEDLFLLAIVVEMEAGGESYQGKLAVANVVINRLLSGKWGKTISSVVYAPNQFSGANSGRIEKFSTRVSADSKKAAVAAAAGENNIGDYLYFRMKSTATLSKYSKYYILGCHCFYMP